MENNIFQVRFKKLRNNKKISMDTLATELGTKKSTISMWENSDVICV